MIFIQASRTRIGIVALVALAMLALPSIAVAGDGSAVSQYTEKVPGSSGKTVGKKKTVLPKTSKASLALLHNRATRKTLENMATSSKFGAPAASLKNVKSQPARNLNSSVGGSLTAAIASSGGGSKGRLVVLLVIIVAISGGIGVVAVRKQRT
ncbi:MAG TPA: hypothetical protein VIJ84_08295 [Gaiellaceae bacterium]